MFCIHKSMTRWACTTNEAHHAIQYIEHINRSVFKVLCANEYYKFLVCASCAALHFGWFRMQNDVAAKQLKSKWISALFIVGRIEFSMSALSVLPFTNFTKSNARWHVYRNKWILCLHGLYKISRIPYGFALFPYTASTQEHCCVLNVNLGQRPILKRCASFVCDWMGNVERNSRVCYVETCFDARLLVFVVSCAYFNEFYDSFFFSFC